MEMSAFYLLIKTPVLFDMLHVQNSLANYGLSVFCAQLRLCAFLFRGDYYMPSCAFFGYTKDKDITILTLDAIADTFEYLIVKKDVKIFYSTAKTDFDSACEFAVGLLKEKYPDIELIKIAGKNDREQREKPAYDHIMNFENRNFRKRYMYTSRLADYILFDTISPRGSRDTLFSDIVYINRNRIDDVHFLSLKIIMKRRDENYRKTIKETDP